jgi:hypothetical protein
VQPHHTIIDHEDTRDEYPAERLRKFKEDHEAKLWRRVPLTLSGHVDVDYMVDHLLDQRRQMTLFVNHFINTSESI